MMKTLAWLALLFANIINLGFFTFIMKPWHIVGGWDRFFALSPIGMSISMIFFILFSFKNVFPAIYLWRARKILELQSEIARYEGLSSRKDD